MRSRTKLSLINNYVEIYKILYSCKQNIKYAEDLDTVREFKELTISTIKLKNRYEKIFEICGINDDSFLLLKQQLNESLLITHEYPKHSSEYNFLNLKKTGLEADLLKFES